MVGREGRPSAEERGGGGRARTRARHGKADCLLARPRGRGQFRRANARARPDAVGAPQRSEWRWRRVWRPAGVAASVHALARAGPTRLSTGYQALRRLVDTVGGLPPLDLHLVKGASPPLRRLCSRPRPPRHTALLGCAMVLEATYLCVDNSDYMRNGDFAPSRMEAQQDAVNLLAGAKTQVRAALRSAAAAPLWQLPSLAERAAPLRSPRTLLASREGKWIACSLCHQRSVISTALAQTHEPRWAEARPAALYLHSLSPPVPVAEQPRELGGRAVHGGPRRRGARGADQ